MHIIDGHLDLAMNALHYERDLTRPLDEVRAREAGGVADRRGTAMVTLPELRDAGVQLVVATLIARCKPWVDPARPLMRDTLDFPTPEMAYAHAMGQWAYYEWLAREGLIRILHDRPMLQHHLTDAHGTCSSGFPLGVVLMMEGADPILNPDDLHTGHARGLRMLSLAHFGHSRYAAGTPPRHPTQGRDEGDAPLTELAGPLLDEMSSLHMGLDLTHLSDRSFAEAVERYQGPVCATHSNCRALADSPRQLTNEQLLQIADRGGVIGIALHTGMIRWDGESAPRHVATLDAAADHVEHICQLAGSTRHVGLGTDADGGFGRESSPGGMERYSDVTKLAPILRDRGFTDDDIDGFFLRNWERYLTRLLT